MSAFYSTVIIVSSSPVPAGILNLTTTFNLLFSDKKYLRVLLLTEAL